MLIFGNDWLLSALGAIDIKLTISSSFFLAALVSSVCTVESTMNDLNSYNSTKSISLSILMIILSFYKCGAIIPYDTDF